MPNLWFKLLKQTLKKHKNTKHGPTYGTPSKKIWKENLVLILMSDHAKKQRQKHLDKNGTRKKKDFNKRKEHGNSVSEEKLLNSFCLQRLQQRPW